MIKKYTQFHDPVMMHKVIEDVSVPLLELEDQAVENPVLVPNLFATSNEDEIGDMEGYYFVDVVDLLQEVALGSDVVQFQSEVCQL